MYTVTPVNAKVYTSKFLLAHLTKDKKKNYEVKNRRKNYQLPLSFKSIFISI